MIPSHRVLYRRIDGVRDEHSDADRYAPVALAGRRSVLSFGAPAASAGPGTQPAPNPEHFANARHARVVKRFVVATAVGDDIKEIPVACSRVIATSDATHAISEPLDEAAGAVQQCTHPVVRRTLRYASTRARGDSDGRTAVNLKPVPMPLVKALFGRRSQPRNGT